MNAVLERLSSLLWSAPVLGAFLITGILFTVRSSFFQLRRPDLWLGTTLFASFRDKRLRKSSDKASISQFQALNAALAACMGTGNVIGVATAIKAGGPGAVFWMCFSAFFGMMTSCAENILGIKYRRRNQKGEWLGGAMMYMEHGIGSKKTAVIFSLLMTFASFGIGNMTQSNSMAQTVNLFTGIPPFVTGIVASVLCALVIFGGVKRIAAVTEKIVPAVSAVFILASLVVIFVNYKNIPSALSLIFREAFSLKSAAGGAAGYGMAKAVRMGISRGVFSNEAGLGSSATIHAAADTDSAGAQGMWGIVEVFLDTIVMCTVTALVILSGSNLNLHSDADGAELFSAAFTDVLGKSGEVIMCVTVALLGFATLIGWSYYGERGAEYVFGLRIVPVYKVIFIICIFIGSITSLDTVWNLSDILNCLMAFPNLISLVLLSGEVKRELKKFSSQY